MEASAWRLEKSIRVNVTEAGRNGQIKYKTGQLMIPGTHSSERGRLTLTTGEKGFHEDGSFDETLE